MPTALSTFGTFSIDTKAEGTVASARLGKFFATGVAAQKLADGFACSLGYCE